MSGHAQELQHGSIAEALQGVRDQISVQPTNEATGGANEVCIHNIQDAISLCYVGLEPGEVTPAVDRRLRDMLRSPYYAAQYNELRITVYPSGIVGKVAHHAVTEFGLKPRKKSQPRIMWMVHKVNLSYDEKTGLKDATRPPASFLVKPFGRDCVMVAHKGFVRRAKRILAWVEDPHLGTFSVSPGHLPVFAVQEGQDPVPGYLIVKRSGIKAGTTVQAEGTVFPEELNVVLPESRHTQPTQF